MTTTIDWEKADQMMMAGCHGTEIAGYFGIHPNTFYRKVEEEKNMTFGEYLQCKRAKGESLLRHQQFVKALGLSDKGDNTLLIWLGKVRLQQREYVDPSFDQEAEKKFDAKMDQVLALLSNSDLKIEESNINNETKS